MGGGGWRARPPPSHAHFEIAKLLLDLSFCLGSQNPTQTKHHAIQKPVF
jgi:hypothetical protein